MPSRDRPTLRWLLAKDGRELVASRAFWLMLVIIGLLVGHAFLTATSTYAELSGAGGGPSVLAQGLSPLDGMLVPTFSAYALAATLLLPFLVIRLVGAERESGALELLLQSPASRRQLIASKFVVLIGAWLVAMIPGFVAMLLWRTSGGHLSWREVAVVVLGHLLLSGITIAVAAAAGGLAHSAASGAIAALSVTVGAWAIDFMAAIRGGFLSEIARYTPSAVLRTFEHGELRLATVLVSLAVIVGGLSIAAITIDVGAPIGDRTRKIMVGCLLTAVAATAASRSRTSLDLSEDRRSSFAESEERVLRGIPGPLHLTVHLAGQDPRRIDLEREVLAKLRRAMRVNVDYVEGTGTGMVSRSDHYGEMVYSIGDRSDTTRSVIEPVVLEIIHRLAGVPASSGSDEERAYPGYPLRRVPGGIVLVFFVAWPIIVLGGWWRLARRA